MPNASYKIHDIMIERLTSSPGAKLGLLTSAPNPDGTGVNEPNNVHGYSRQSVFFGSTQRLSGGNAGKSQVSNTNPLIFGPAHTVGWPAVTHFAIFDDEDELVFYGALPTSRVAAIGDAITFGVGAVQPRFA